MKKEKMEISTELDMALHSASVNYLLHQILEIRRDLARKETNLLQDALKRFSLGIKKSISKKILSRLKLLNQSTMPIRCNVIS